MSQDIYLYLDGIPGESVAKGVENWIEVHSFSNGLSNHSSVAAGTGSGAGRVDFSAISITKQLDKATPKLALNCMKGTHIAKGTLVVRQSTGNEATKTYYQYDLTEVFVDSMNWGGSIGQVEKPSEQISFTFNQINISYSAQNTDGTLQGPVTVGWNSKINKSV